jgi:hypothetical protein
VTIPTAVAEAMALNMAPAPITMRPRISQVSEAASAEIRQPRLNRASARQMLPCRDHFTVIMIISGASTAVDRA